MLKEIDPPELIIEPLLKAPVPVKKLYTTIINKAWEGYDQSKKIREIEDIRAMVSTNHVFRITFEDDDIIIAKREPVSIRYAERRYGSALPAGA